MNPAWAEAFGFIFKLRYHFPKKEKPALEVFANDDEAKSKEWHIYGAPADAEDDSERVAKIEFSALNETKEFHLAGSTFRIQYVNLGEIEFDYPRGGKTIEPVYEFVLESLEEQ